MVTTIHKSSYTVLATVLLTVQGAVVPPPWADPTFNPCASQPGGWQLIYWPPDKKCYRIFTRGYPCPETMELSPGPDKGTPECNCPPGTAQSARDSRCYTLYEKEPCDDGEFFAPTNIKSRKMGNVSKAESCVESGQLLWPKDGRCYPRNARGPCAEGRLFVASTESALIGKCGCENSSELAQYYWSPTGTCHEHYTTGPCQERGGLFLPGGVCGCQSDLPHYHNATAKCYQLGGIGPCSAGHQFIVPPSSSSSSQQQQNANNPGLGKTTRYAECVCKDGHIKWFGDGACYRPFTRGPCSPGFIYSVNITATGMAIGCVPLPCPAGKLYFPTGNGCHKVGTQGPCPNGQVVLFQDSVKTSVDGISYLGMCGCPSTNEKDSFFPSLSRSDNDTSCLISSARSDDNNSLNSQPDLRQKSSDACGNKRGIIAWSDGSCKQLYSQGPCNSGEWVVPDRSKGQRKGRGWKMGKCECRPGYTAYTDDTNATVCQPPSVILAKFLNNKTETTSVKSETKYTYIATSSVSNRRQNDESTDSTRSNPFKNNLNIRNERKAELYNYQNKIQAFK